MNTEQNDHSITTNINVNTKQYMSMNTEHNARCIILNMNVNTKQYSVSPLTWI